METKNGITDEQWLASQQLIFVEQIVEELRELIPDLSTELTPRLMLSVFADAGLDMWFGKDSTIALEYIQSSIKRHPSNGLRIIDGGGNK
jgi:hypothetical protein